MKRLLCACCSALLYASVCFAASPGYFKSIPPDTHFTGTLHGWSGLTDSTSSFRVDGASITKVGTVDGRDVSADGTKLDGVSLSTASLKTELTAETTTRAAADVSIGISTGTIYSVLQATAAALSVETTNRASGDTALGISTGTLVINISSLGISTGTIQTQVNAIVVSTNSLQTQINSLGISTGSISSIVSQVGIDTGTIRTDLHTLQYSTYTVASITLAPSQVSAGVFDSDVIISSIQAGAYENIRVGTATVSLSANAVSAANVTAGTLPAEVKISTANISPASDGSSLKYLSADGTFSTPAGAGDVTKSGDNYMTGYSTFTKGIAFNDSTRQTTAFIPLVSVSTNPATGAVTATSYTAIVGSTVSITTQGNTYLKYSVGFGCSVGAGAFKMTVMIDGVRQGIAGVEDCLYAEPAAGAYSPFSFMGRTHSKVSAGAHTLYLQAKVVSGASIIYAEIPFWFIVEEMY